MDRHLGFPTHRQTLVTVTTWMICFSPRLASYFKHIEHLVLDCFKRYLPKKQMFVKQLLYWNGVAGFVRVNFEPLQVVTRGTFCSLCTRLVSFVDRALVE